MKHIKLGIIILVLILTGCSDSDDERDKFIEECESKPGCTYKVFSEQCVCDKTHDYVPAP